MAENAATTTRPNAGPSAFGRASPGRARRGRRPFGRFARFAGREDGTSLIEFAFVGLPFLMIVVVMLETALTFFVERMLQDGVVEAKRQLRLNNATTEADFRQVLCDVGVIKMAFRCSNIVIDIREISSGGGAPAAPFGPDGSIDPSRVVADPGPRGSINVVRVYYEWPRFLPYATTGNGRAAQGKTLLIGATAYKAEL